jgi:hypothetical protein
VWNHRPCVERARQPSLARKTLFASRHRMFGREYGNHLAVSRRTAFLLMQQMCPVVHKLQRVRGLWAPSRCVDNVFATRAVRVDHGDFFSGNGAENTASTGLRKVRNGAGSA